MKEIKGHRLHVKLGASQVRRRLKGLGYGVRKVESAGRGEAVIIHTATGQHLRELQAIFHDVLEPDKPERSVSAPEQLSATSKFLSLVLRHRPEVIGIELDAEGWVDVEKLLAACAKHGRAISREQLDAAVRTNDKQRFAYSADGNRIRANQGHSLPIDLGLVPEEPPELLYHGTVPQFLEAIRREGLIKGKRHHVHLSADFLRPRAWASVAAGRSSW